MIKVIIAKVLRWMPFLSKLTGWQSYALVAAAALAAGLYSGYKVTSLVYHGKELVAIKRALAEQKKEMDKNQAAELALIRKNQKTEIIYKDRIKKVIQYVEKHGNAECFDADGLQLYRDNLSGKASDPAKP